MKGKLFISQQQAKEETPTPVDVLWKTRGEQRRKKEEYIHPNKSPIESQKVDDAVENFYRMLIRGSLPYPQE